MLPIDKESLEALERIANTITEALLSSATPLYPRIKKAMLQRLIEIADESIAHDWRTNEIFRELIRKSTEKHLETTYAKAIDALGKKRARKVIVTRAKQAGVEPGVLPGMGASDE